MNKQVDLMSGLEAASEVQDFIDLDNSIGDEELMDALGLALKCIAHPTMSVGTARGLMIKFQAFSMKFRAQSLVYQHIHKGTVNSPEGLKKNAYYALSKQCHELAQTMKYIVREF